MEEDLYCKIYVNSCLDGSSLLAYLAEVVKGDVSLRTVENELFELSVFKNEDYQKDKAVEDGGFVFYPYYLEVEPADEDSVDRQAYKLAIGNLLKTFWSSNVDAVAACDFEDELPKNVTS